MKQCCPLEISRKTDIDMHVQMSRGGRNCLVTSQGEEGTTFPVATLR